MKKAIVFKIKTNKKAIWDDWCVQLSTHFLQEATLSLVEEKVLQELTLGFSLNGEHFVVGFMNGDCLPANMEREVNNIHQKMKAECLERVSEAEILYDITTR